jgi:hypothetical protein
LFCATRRRGKARLSALATGRRPLAPRRPSAKKGGRTPEKDIIRRGPAHNGRAIGAHGREPPISRSGQGAGQRPPPARIILRQGRPFSFCFWPLPAAAAPASRRFSAGGFHRFGDASCPFWPCRHLLCSQHAPGRRDDSPAAPKLGAGRFRLTILPVKC